VQLSPQSVKNYRCVTKMLTAWGGKKYTGDLDLAALRSLRVQLAGSGKSPHTWNNRIRVAKSVLNHLRKAGYCARLSSDQINAGLELYPAPRPAPVFLLPPVIRTALELEMDPEERALVLLCLLGGLRLAEGICLRWEQVDLESELLRLDDTTKARRWRLVDLRVTPLLLEALKALPKDADLVLPSFNQDTRHRRVRELRKRLPRSFKYLRSTCSTYLTNAPGIFGERSLFLAAKSLGHSPQIAETHYAGHLPRLSADARTLEAAMGIKLK
jgi:integrase